MPISTNGSTNVNVFASGAFISGALPVTSSQAHPIYITGSLSAVSVENSVGKVGDSVPVSATLIGAEDASSNMQTLRIDNDHNLLVAMTGILAVSQTNRVTEIEVLNFPAVSAVELTGALSVVDIGNSTETELLANASFTGTSVDLLGYAGIQVSIFSDQASAVDGIRYQFSPDDVNWSDIILRSYGADLVNTHVDENIRTHDRYFRLIYKNGASAQVTFRIQTLLNRYQPSADVINVDKQIKGGQDAFLTKAIVAGKNEVTGEYNDVGTDGLGHLIVAGATILQDNTSNPDNALNVGAYTMIWDSDASLWQRGRTGDNSSDNDDVHSIGLIAAETYPKVFNGSTFDRIRGDTTGLWTKIVDSINLTATLVNATASVSVSNFPTTQTITGTVHVDNTVLTVTSTQANPVFVTGNLTVAGGSNVTIVGSTITTPVYISSSFPTASGSIAALGNTVSMQMGNSAGVAVTVVGTFSGTLAPQISYDHGLTWRTVDVWNPDYKIESISVFITSSGTYIPYTIAGASHVRISASSWTSGQADIVINGNANSPGIEESAVENGEAIPKYGVMIGGADDGVFRFIHVDESGSTLVTSSYERPVWVTGVITSVQSASGTFYTVENSVAKNLGLTALSSTLIAANNTGTQTALSASHNGWLMVSGAQASTQDGAWGVTVSGTVTATFTGSVPVNTGTMPVVTVTSSQALPVWSTGTFHIDNNVLLVTSSVNDPVYVSVTGAIPISQSNIPAGTASVSVSNFPAINTVTASITNPVSVTGIVHFDNNSFAVSVNNFPVSQPMSQYGAWSSFVSGTVGVTQSGALSVNATGVVGIVQSGALTAQVSNSVGIPLWITASIGTPLYVRVTGAMPVSASGQYATGAQDPQSGTLMLAVDATNKASPPAMDANRILYVDVASGTVAITQGGAVSVLATGNVSGGDSMNGSTVAVPVVDVPLAWNGSTYDRLRSSPASAGYGMWVRPPPAGTTLVTGTVVTGTVVTILQANPNRLFASILNNSTGTSVIYVRLGTGATIASSSVRMAQNSYYEIPSFYTGALTAVSSGTGITGTVSVTELSF